MSPAGFDEREHTTMSTTTTTTDTTPINRITHPSGMAYVFFENTHGNPPGKLADVEIHFPDGPCRGLKLIGFAVWERKNGGRNVTFPARQYSVNGERRSFALLRPHTDPEAQDQFRDEMLEAYAQYRENVDEADSDTPRETMSAGQASAVR
jgi:hypothetical protein